MTQHPNPTSPPSPSPKSVDQVSLHSFCCAERSFQGPHIPQSREVPPGTPQGSILASPVIGKGCHPVGGDPLSAVTEAPSVDHLSLTPRPALAAATERARLLRKKVALPDPSYRQQQQHILSG